MPVGVPFSIFLSHPYSDTAIPVTISTGVSIRYETITVLLEKVDKAACKAKKRRRNKVGYSPA